MATAPKCRLSIWPQRAARGRPADQLPVEADEERQGHRSGRQPDKSRAWFGATVTLADEDDQERVVTLVGEDEADAGAGAISWSSPLAGPFAAPRSATSGRSSCLPASATMR
jgi:hypothetical protein